MCWVYYYSVLFLLATSLLSVLHVYLYTLTLVTPQDSHEYCSQVKTRYNIVL